MFGNYTGTRNAELHYRWLIEDGASPEQACLVLTNSLKTEIIMTTNLREWRHILKLHTAKDTHPQMRQVAKMILDVLKEKLPVIFEDIDVLNGFNSVTIKGGLVL